VHAGTGVPAIPASSSLTWDKVTAHCVWSHTKLSWRAHPAYLDCQPCTACQRRRLAPHPHAGPHRPSPDTRPSCWGPRAQACAGRGESAPRLTQRRRRALSVVAPRGAEALRDPRRVTKSYSCSTPGS